ncbi:hypothetical protein GCM10029964_057620 [Kibdelosporangium lantanae]
MSGKQAAVSALVILVVLFAAAVLAGVPERSVARLDRNPVPLDTVALRIRSFTAGLAASQPYRPPDATERSTAAAGFADLFSPSRQARSPLTKLGFTVADLVDPVTGRPYTLVRNEAGTDRAWGMYLVDRSGPPSLAVEVPHPAFDLRTELYGVDLFRRVPGAVLMIAGAHRRADDDRADVAHEADSVFHVLATYLAGRGLPQLQFHGFDDASAPGYDIVLSTGSSQSSGTEVRVGTGFDRAGFTVCRAWQQACAGLEAETNVQGQLARTAGTVFVHVEMSRTVRNNDPARARVVKALVEAKVGLS